MKDNTENDQKKVDDIDFFRWAEDYMRAEYN